MLWRKGNIFSHTCLPWWWNVKAALCRSLSLFRCGVVLGSSFIPAISWPITTMSSYKRVSSEQDARRQKMDSGELGGARMGVDTWEEQGRECVSSEQDACTDIRGARTGADPIPFLHPQVVSVMAATLALSSMSTCRSSMSMSSCPEITCSITSCTRSSVSTNSPSSTSSSSPSWLCAWDSASHGTLCYFAIIIFYALTCNICFTVTVTLTQFTRTTTWWHGEVVLNNIYKWSLVSLLQLEEAVDSWGNVGSPRSALRSHSSARACNRIHRWAAKVTVLKGNSRLRDSVKGLIIPVFPPRQKHARVALER